MLKKITFMSTKKQASSRKERKEKKKMNSFYKFIIKAGHIFVYFQFV